MTIWKNWPAVTLIAGLIIAPFSGENHATGAPLLPHFAPAACPFTLSAGLVAGRDVRCGFVVVPENRNLPAGPAIRLAVAIFKSQRAHPRPDPFVFLQGGPGGSIIGQLGPTITAQTRVTDYPADRDVVLLDQRGTGFSQPSLACTEITALDYRTLDQQLSLSRQAAQALQATRQCYHRLTAAGIDLNAYTTLADAADVADLRVALGYPTLNLYAVSYGTRLALTVMRTHPQGIRSVVLDSVEPPGLNAITTPLISAARAFGVLFAGCAAQRACAAAFPHLPATLDAAVQHLNAAPVTIQTSDPTTQQTETVLLTGNRLEDLLFSALYVTLLIPDLPALIALAAQGNERLPALIYGPLQLTDHLDNLGVYLSVECGEDAPFTTAATIRTAAQALDPVLRPDMLAGQLSELQQCQSWPVRPVPSAQRQPVVSTIPTLILSGQYDPITPPNASLEAAQTLHRSYRFVFPGTGHGVFQTNPCPDRIVDGFEDNPLQRPDASCIAAMTAPRFFVLPQR